MNLILQLLQFRFVLTLTLIGLSMPVVANASTELKELEKIFDEALEFDLELMEFGKNSQIVELFAAKVGALEAGVLRKLAMQAYTKAENNPKYYAISALLFYQADKLSTQGHSPTRRWKGYAAFTAADLYSDLSVDSAVIGPAFRFPIYR